MYCDWFFQCSSQKDRLRKQVRYADFKTRYLWFSTIETNKKIWSFTVINSNSKELLHFSLKQIGQQLIRPQGKTQHLEEKPEITDILP